MKAMRLAWRLFKRQRRAGDLRLIMLALAVAVAALVSVTSFADRLHRALQIQGGELLAADLLVRASYPPADEWAAESARRGLRTTRTVTFRSVIVRGEQSQLAEVKAVAAGYPLRGALRITDAPGAHDRPAAGIPPPGTVWMDAQLLVLLDVRPGDPVTLGKRRFVVDKIITLEPDRGGEVFAIAPRIMLNLSDLAATELIQPGSLATYGLLIAGAQEAVEDFRRWFAQQSHKGATMLDTRNAQPRFQTALERGERFLGLTTLVSVLLAGVAVARAARHFAERHLDAVALMRCFGAPQRDILRLFLYQLLILGTVSSAIGGGVGYVAQQAFVYLFPDLVAGELPWPSLVPAIMGLVVGITTLAGFASPIVLRLQNVPPLRVLRRELGALPNRIAAVYLTALGAFAVLVLWIGEDPVLSAYVLGGGLLTVVALAAMSHLAILAAGRLRRRAGMVWRFGMAALARRSRAATGQIVALGVGVMAILLLTLVRNDLLEAWRTTIPPGTPNHFLINIQPHQIADIEAFFRNRGWPGPNLRPIVRARLTAINASPVQPQDFDSAFAKRVVQRAANLSWVESLQSDNRLTAGSWWTENEWSQALVSVEERYARALNMKLGDELTYVIGDRRISVTVHSLRSVLWDSFQPNFFLIVPPRLLSEYPVSYITSLYVEPSQSRQLYALIKRFPNVTDIDVDALLQQVRRLMDRVNLALEYVFFFTVVAGVVVLYTAIYTSAGERRAEVAVLRTLGAHRRQLSASMAAEFVLIGFLAGVVGALSAVLVGFGVSEYVLDIPFRINFHIFWIGTSAATAVVTLAGTVASYRLWRTPPWRILREV